MSKEYVFEFNGTKEELLNKLNTFPNNEYSNGRFYYFDAYIYSNFAADSYVWYHRTGLYRGLDAE